ncbi:27 kDa glycoprotein-like [Cydia splendana]|uniref:27 kDa glycoprotein-like n=1 Tax=Cydia splendana TaxID=1100963 RepID=UPI00213FABE3
MIWILSLLVALIPVVTVDAWGKYNALDQKQITEYVTKLCTKSGAEDKVPQVLDAIENFEKCSVSLFKDEVLLEEVATAIRNNDLNGVFKKYCARTGRLAACTYSLIDSVGLCVAGADLPAAHNFIDQLLGFVCHNDGERIALFIQEGGPQCFQQNVGSLNGCAAKVLSEIDGVQPVKERCTNFDDLSKCLVETVSTCSPAAPGDMMRALLAHVRQATPCAADDDTFRTYMRWLQDRKDNTDQH